MNLYSIIVSIYDFLKEILFKIRDFLINIKKIKDELQKKKLSSSSSSPSILYKSIPDIEIEDNEEIYVKKDVISSIIKNIKTLIERNDDNSENLKLKLNLKFMEYIKSLKPYYDFLTKIDDIEITSLKKYLNYIIY